MSNRALHHHGVAVIGAGIAGVSTALHLLMRGEQVVLIDRLPAGQATSYGNAGIIGNGYVLPFGFPNLQETIAILRNRSTAAHIQPSCIPRYLPWFLRFYLKSRPAPRTASAEHLWPLHKNSTEDHRALMHGTDAERHLYMGARVSLYRRDEDFDNDDLFLRVAREKNVPYDVMDAGQFSALEPQLKPIYKKAVRWTTSAQLRNPGAVTAAYAERFVTQGGKFFQARVQDIQHMRDGSWKMITNSEPVTADRVVICTGPDAAQMLKPLGHHFPMISKRGYHKHYKVAQGVTLNHALVDAQYGYVLSPMDQGIRLTTGVEFANPGTPPTPVQLDRALPHARELFPLEYEVESKAWMGNRPCFADSLPVIGPSHKHKGLWFNFGHGHLGMTIAPSSAKLLAEMMTGVPTFCDTAPYRADRF